MARQRASFFSVPALVLTGALVALVLYLLFPRQAVFEDPDFLRQPDGLSIAYLDVLLRSDPGNVPLRINLVTQLQNAGQRDRAARVLAPVMNREEIPYAVYERHIQLQQQRLNDQPPGPMREGVRLELFTSLNQLLEQPYGTDRIMRLLQPASRSLTQTQQLSLLQALQPRLTEPRQQLSVAQQLARLQEAEGRPGDAADTLHPHLDTVEAGHRRAFIDNLIRLELASGDPGAALSLFQRTHGRAVPMDSATLRQGLRLARLAGAGREEAQWLRQLARREPGDLALQRQLLAQQLADGELEQALETVQRLQAHPGELSVSDRERIAQVLEWNLRPREALSVWVELYEQSDSQLAYDRALDLSQGLYLWQRRASLLVTRRQRSGLSPWEYQQLAEALVRQGEPVAARTRLAQGLSRYPDAPGLQQQKLALLLDLRAFPEAIQWLESQTDLSDAARVTLARLYWQTRQPEAALDSLAFQPLDPQLAEEAAAMRLDLAALLGRQDLLEQEYQRLLADSDRTLTVNQLDRLRNLAVIFSDYPSALRLTQRLYRKTGEQGHLAAVAEYQRILGDRDGLEETLARWQEDFPARDSPRFWSLTALNRQHRQEPVSAQEAWQRAWQLSPGDEALLIDWGWFLLQERERDPDRFTPGLTAVLARLAENPSPDAYPVLAYGHSALGNRRQSLHWFRQGLAGRGEDMPWLAGTARLLDQTGAPADAWHLRQKVAEQMQDDPMALAERVSLHQARQDARRAWEILGDFAVSEGASGQPESGTREALAFFALSENQPLVAEALVSPATGAAPGSERRLESALYPRPRTRREQIRSLTRQLDETEQDHSREERASLTRDTRDLHQRHNRAVQTGIQWQNLGGFTLRRTGVTTEISEDEYRWGLALENLSADGPGRLARTPDSALHSRVSLDRTDARFDWRLTAALHPREGRRDAGASAGFNWQGLDRISLGASAHYRERTPDSAEAWWITRRDRLSAETGYNPFPRLGLSARLDAMSITSLEGDTLGQGLGVDLAANYRLFRNDPAWSLMTSYQRRELSLRRELPQATQARLAQPLATGELITETFERIGISSRWFHGEPQALFRSTPSPRFTLGVSAGYVLSTDTPDFGLEAGLGWRLVGDDELAFSTRFTSESLDGEGRTDFNLTYTLYLGR